MNGQDETRETGPKKGRKPSDDVVAISKRVVDILDIVQLSGAFSVDSDHLHGGLRVSVLEGPVDARLEGESRLVVTLDFTFEAIPDDQDSSHHRAVYVRAAYKLTYELQVSEDEPSPNALKAFAEINGRFNATAYWREYLHHSLSRAGLPPYFVPPFDAAVRLRSLNKGEI